MEQSATDVEASARVPPGSVPRRLALVAVLVAATLPYAATRAYAFVWDDHLILRHVGRAFEDGGLLGVLSAPFLPSPDVPNNFYRPVVYFTYWLDQSVGGEHARIAHLDNVLLHACVAVLVLALARRLLDDDIAAFAAGALFAVHPVNVESVAWVAGRTDILCALFSLATALVWLLGAGLPATRARATMVVCSGMLFVVACLSKEAAIVLPVLLLPLSLARQSGPDSAGRHGAAALLLRWGLAFVPATAVVAAARYLALRDELGQVPLAQQVRHSLLVQDPATAFGVLVHTLRVLLVPWPHSALLEQGDVRIDLVSLLAVAILAALAGWVAMRVNRRAGLWAATWIIAFAVPNLLKPGDAVIVGAERYAYLVAIGATILMGALAGSAGPPQVPRTARVVSIVVLVSILGFASFQRTRVWANDDTLTADLIRTSPGSALAHQLRAEAQLSADQLQDAIASYRRALSLAPGSATLLHSLGRALLRSGDPSGAADAFQAAVQAEPDWAAPHVGLGVACATLGNWLCVDAQREALRQFPRDLALLDRILRRSGR